MGFLIAGPDTVEGGLSTWGKLRSPVCQIGPYGDYQEPTLNLPHNTEWDAVNYFTSAATGGFLKQGFLLLTPSTLPSVANAYPPTININEFGFNTVEVRLDASFDENTLMAQLTGEAVGGWGGSFNITAAMNSGSVIVTGSITSIIGSVGKLAQTV